MNFKGFVGPTYNLKSKNVDGQRCVNLYPEVVESGSGKEAEVAYLKSTDGLKKFIEVGTGPIRCIHVDSFGTTFVVSGSEVYRIIELFVPEYSLSAYKLGNIGSSVGPVIAASSDPGSDRITVFCDGGVQNYLYLYPETGVESFGSYAAYGYPPVSGATHVAFIDGYLIFSVPNTNQFYVSNPNSPDVNPLDFASSEASPDKINGIIAANRELWLFNEQSIEVWANSGNADFPFERISGGFIEIGCIAKYSIAKSKGHIFWLSQNGSVYMAKGLNPQRVSTHAIEQKIQTALDIKSGIAFAYEKDGHTFYCLSFNEFTLCYDLTTGLWHERAYTNEGALERHRANFYAYYDKFENIEGAVTQASGELNAQAGNAYSRHYVGDYANNKVYVLDSDYYKDDEQMITRLRVAPHISNQLKNLFHKSLQIDMEVGVGLDGLGQGVNPKAMLRFSDDGGHKWSNEKLAEIGKIGERFKRVIWRRLGRSRDRVYELKITDPVPVTIIGAQIEVEGGVS